MLALEARTDIMIAMKTISVSVSESEYETYRSIAGEGGMSIAHLIREAMVFYRAERLAAKTPLTDLPVLIGHRPAAALPARHEIYDELFGDPLAGNPDAP